MRMSLWLTAVALCLGAGSSAMAQSVNFSGFSSPSNGVGFSPFGAVSNAINNLNPFATNTSGVSPPQGVSQATYPTPGQSLAGPTKLFNLLPTGVGTIGSNVHYIGASVFPSTTSQYLAQFGYQRLR